MADRHRQVKSKYTAERNMPGAYSGETVTRRRAMTMAVHGAGAVAAGAIVVPGLIFSVGPIFKKTPTRWEAIGRPGDFTPTEYVPRVFTEVTGVGEIGKTTAYVRKRDPAVDGPPRDQFDDYIAISTRCTHVGCPVRYAAAAQRFICPCHGSVFDFEGRRVAGPAVRPLDHFYTRVSKGFVELGPRYSVNSELQRFSPRDPGEPLDGIGQYLYPSRPSIRKLPGPH